MAVTTTLAHSLARHTSSLTHADIPAEIIRSCKLRTLDILGVALAAATQTSPSILRQVVFECGTRPEATVLGFHVRASVLDAALVNGTLAHALDFDDTHHGSRVHVSTVLVPAALAVAESSGVGGRDFITGLAGGMEVAIRVGLAAPGVAHDRGFHATSVYGPLGAAAAASRILALDEDACMHAVAAAASASGGLRESYLGIDGATDTKALHAGQAARAGVLVALLARRGFTGPSTAIEGRFGLLEAFIAPKGYEADEVVRGLGEAWHLPEIAYKMYPCGSLIHASIAAAIQLRAEAELHPDDIAEITCIMPPGMVTTVLEPRQQKRAPRSDYEAKFSAQYAVAAALVDGFITESSFDVRDRPGAFWDLLQRTEYEEEPEMPFPEKYPGGVRVTTKSGRTVEKRLPNAPGTLEVPVTDDDILNKFRANAEPVLGTARCDELAGRVLDLEREDRLSDVLALCRVRH